MNTVSDTELQAHFSRYLEECEEGPIIVTKNGRPVAALVAVADGDDLERLILAHTPRFRRLLDEAGRRVSETGGLAHDDFWKVVEAGP
jgi:prevent-host-death family protein